MSGETILVVEDEPACREMVKAILVDRGYVVREASDGVAALEVLEAGPVDLVLTDLSMPRMDGMALLAELRKRFPGLGVVVFSALDMDEKVIRCIQLGALDFLRKPIRLARLTATVKSALRARKGPAPALDVHRANSGWLELTADSAPETAGRLRTCVERLTETQVSPEVAEELRFAIDELGRNAVEWGNRGQRAKHVRLSYCLFEEKVMFKIEDEGDGFNPGVVPDPSEDPDGSLKSRESQGKRAGGFGIHLVRKLMDEVIYNEKGNVVVMSKYLTGPKAARPSGTS